MASNKTSHIFISHASADDVFVKALRIKLESQGLTVWVDSRNLRGGDQLKPKIKKAIKKARHVLVVLSPNTINSIWVRDEIHMAEKTAKKKADYRVIPLLLEGIEPTALKLWFQEEPAGEKIAALETGRLQEAMPRILAALGERLPDDVSAPKAITAKPIAELLLELSRPTLSQQADDSFQLSSEAELEYIPSDTTQPRVKSKRFMFNSPIGQIDQDNLHWYLEVYVQWPADHDKERGTKPNIPCV